MRCCALGRTLGSRKKVTASRIKSVRDNNDDDDESDMVVVMVVVVLAVVVVLIDHGLKWMLYRLDA